MLVSNFPYRYCYARGNKGGILEGEVTYATPIRGYSCRLKRYVGKCWVDCELFRDGTLVARAGTQWDFGSGPAVNTPPMVRASLAHDMFCHLTNAGLLPWRCRWRADWYFACLLWRLGSTVPIAWRYPGVVLYSQLIAWWRDGIGAGAWDRLEKTFMTFLLVFSVIIAALLLSACTVASYKDQEGRSLFVADLRLSGSAVEAELLRTDGTKVTIRRSQESPDDSITAIGEAVNPLPPLISP